MGEIPYDAYYPDEQDKQIASLKARCEELERENAVLKARSWAPGGERDALNVRYKEALEKIANAAAYTQDSVLPVLDEAIQVARTALEDSEGSRG